ncbi:MAG: hypothetical protein ACE5ER_01855 [Nitrospinaceae bacterium]
MSTILKSLRKLEEEKKGLDQRIDLKTMVIRQDPRRHQEPSRAKPLAWWGGLGLIGAGIALGGGIMLLMQPAAPAKSASATLRIAPEAREALSVPAQAAAAQALGGVPLSSIPQTAVFKTKPAAAKPLPTAAAPVPDAAPEPAAWINTPPAPPVAARLPAGEEIVKALSTVPAQTRYTLPPSFQSPPVMVVEGFPPHEIPGLKVKGIIYFGEGSPENYLFFTTPGTNIQKLKVGEGVLDATLTGIQPGQARFDYQGQSLVLRVGN